LLIDGIPHNDNCYGTAYTWEITPLTFVKNVEIIRGPGSALYGSNATNGVLQVNTLSAADFKAPYGGEAQIRIGQNGLQVYDGLVAHSGRLFSAVAAINSFETDGNNYASHDGSGRLDADGDPLRFTTRDERHNHYLWLKLDGEGDLKGLSLQWHEQAWDFQTGHGWLWWIPDFAESMREQRRLISIQYRPRARGGFHQEYVLRYQRHRIDWNMRYYPNEAFSWEDEANGQTQYFYPIGMWEYLHTEAEDIFMRVQFTLDLPQKATLLTGVEADVFTYSGDKEHYSNVDVDDTFAPFERYGLDTDPADRNQHITNIFEPLGPWFDFVRNKPVKSLGVYGQLTSGEWLSRFVKVTAGVRYDRLFFDYVQIYADGRPETDHSFDQLSPRIACVVLPQPNLAFKAMYGSAFRAPANSEMFGAHTFTLASNIDELKPEKIETYELAMDWGINQHLTFRVTGFHTQFENQIAYSTQNNNLSTNIYTLTNAGLETEILFGFKSLQGFFNHSYVDRLDETIIDRTIAESPKRLTWEPQHKVNCGAAYTYRKLKLAVSGHYHGSVKRRDTDVGVQALPLGVGVELEMDRYRGRSVDSWVTLDTRIGYQATSDLNIALTATNVLDEKYYLVKNSGFPFDYQQEGRRVFLSARLSF
jgi:outer membrane receptor protein involved in Fe transport